LADFELALKALDSYIEIVVSAKDRAEKSAEAGQLEDDETLLRTVSEGVLLLCCFGSQKEAEKAKSLIEIIEKYLEKDISQDFSTDGKIQQEADSGKVNRVSPKVIAMAYKAIGIALANWSRWTPVSESRDDIRAEAIENLERSIAPELGEEANVSTLYALALILAESRDLDGSIEHVKLALSTNSHRADSTDLSFELDQARLSRERDLIPLWHLLALLMSAKQEFDIAGRSCEAAFEQFPVAAMAFGSNKRATRHRRDSSQRGRRDSTDARKDFLECLRAREKERILETRMTQLALIELQEGPDVAVNHSDQLLSLFATLFDRLDFDVTERTPKTERLVPPKSSAETVKSFRGSIFGRKKGSRVQERRNGVANDGGNVTFPVRESASIADAPAIQVTDEDRDLQRGNSTGHKLHKRESSSIAARRDHSQESQTRADGSNATQQNSKENPPAEEIGIAMSEPPASQDPASAQKQSAKQPLPPVAHNIKHHRQPPPAGHAKQPPEQDVRLPTPHRFESPTRALTRFPIAQAQKHALAVLVKVWLLIAGLYRRASLFEDAHEACEEAAKQTSRFEALVALEESSARAFSQRPWGVGKSSEELWGDVNAERGAISQAQSLPYEAMEHFEDALMRYPDHPKAIVGLANLLLDIWEEKIPAEPPQPHLEADISTLSLSKHVTGTGTVVVQKKTTAAPGKSNGHVDDEPTTASSSRRGEVPERSLSRLAARDRAYGLLSTLTKQGSSWDDSVAWFALARAYEAGGQLDKTKELLWWCVELEDRKPIRHWWNLSAGGYVL
jgi:tetratricopeptide (TPR) repeat protein